MDIILPKERCIVKVFLDKHAVKWRDSEEKAKNSWTEGCLIDERKQIEIWFGIRA
jgi:hypothetical protein